MMKRLLHFTAQFLSVLFVLFSLGVKAQIVKNFTPDSVKFTAELVQYSSSSFEKEGLQKFELFIQTVLTDKRLRPVNRQQIYKIANYMLQMRMRPTPNFTSLFNTLDVFLKSNQPQSSITNWLNGLQLIANDKKSRQLMQVIDATARLFTTNIIYKSVNTQWTVRKGSFIFEADSVPYAVFKSVDLVCKGNRDSTEILQTSGRYYPSFDHWKGKGGTVYWDRAGFTHNEVYTILNNYRLNLRFSTYKADSVKLIDKKYFKAPLEGRFEEMVQATNVTPDRAVFPKFDSFDKKLFLDKIFENINYEGGFMLEGNRFIGNGSETHGARLVFLNSGKPFATVTSKTFFIRSDRLLSSRAAVTVYYDSDSIYNGSVQMLYTHATKEVAFSKTEDGLPSGPFFDSYHKIDIQVEAMHLKLGDNIIRFEMTKGLTKESLATFESSSFYPAIKYNRLQGIDEVNPINVVYFYTQAMHVEQFTVNELADQIKKPIEQVRAMLAILATNGFILFDPDTNIAVIKPRLADFLAAHSGKKDYDVIRFNSKVVSISNALLNMKNGDLTINGVSDIMVSSAQNVHIYPSDSKVLIKKGLDFVFTGRVHAGLFDFYANKSSFEYEKFKLNMPTIDSMTFAVKRFERDANGNHPLVAVKSSVDKLSGDLLIDKADNKSGLKKNLQYPVFNSKTDAFVYYDRKDILNGAYPKSKFFYTVKPFVLDSLNSFSTDGLSFNGTLTAGDLFAKIEEPIKVQKDYSLGFIKKVSEAGIPVYTGKGKFYDKISLSNNGLRGDGRLSAYASESESNNYIFYPDSLTAPTRKFLITEQAQPVVYPSVKAEGAYQRWLPASDIMYITNAKDKPFNIMNNKVLLTGLLTLSSKALVGKGHLTFDQADMVSKLYAFRQKGFMSDTTSFKLNASDGSGIVLKTTVARSDVDFSKNLANFATSGKGAKIEFPVNQYIGSMNQFTWTMDQSKVILQNNIAQRIQNFNKLSKKELIDIDLSSSEFVSTLPGKDPLRFSSLQATYDLKENILYAEDVKILKVADAALFPTNGQVTILKNGSMKAFDDATIIANRQNKSHTIYGAKVTVQNSRSYYASGIYDYADESGQSQQIRFSNIGVDTTGQTYAHATISDSAQFKLNPAFGFMGDVDLKASSKFLSFKGGFKIHSTCLTKNEPQWTRFKAEVDPMNVVLPISADPRDMTNSKLMASIAFSITENLIYAPFFAAPAAYSDLAMTPITGFIHYNTKEQSYVLSTEETETKNSTADKLILDNRRCVVTATGKVNTGVDFGRVNMELIGNTTYSIIPDSLKMNVITALVFFFSDAALEKFKDELQLANLKGINLNGDVVNKALKLTLGESDFRKIAEDISLFGTSKKSSEKLNKTMLLTDVKLQWNADSRSFIGKGPIGIFSLGKYPVNKYVNGYIEISRRRSGDILNIYFELAKGNWYYFNYSSGALQAISSNEEFNTILTGIRDDKRTLAVKNNEAPYQFIISTPDKRLSFTRKMQQIFSQTNKP
ncbi:MAG: hypothetical protein HXX14_11190 [Bacteroidetes bacterium]|nr:hypothetical protein [Bacteroidota bacterium]